MEYHFNFAKKPLSYKDLPQEGGRLTLAYSRIYDSANQSNRIFSGRKRWQNWRHVWYRLLKNDNGEFILTSAGNYIADNNLIKIGNYNPDFL
jgi:hypothetical protein